MECGAPMKKGGAPHLGVRSATLKVRSVEV